MTTDDIMNFSEFFGFAFGCTAGMLLGFLCGIPVLVFICWKFIQDIIKIVRRVRRAVRIRKHLKNN